MKRFYRDAYVIATGEAFGIMLDNRPVLTPGRAVLSVPTVALAEAIATEWCGQGETVEPRSMRLTGLANAAVDRAAMDTQAFSTGLVRYAETDLLFYCAEGPPELASAQAAAWNPILAWAERCYGVTFAITRGVIHVAQPPRTIATLTDALEAIDPFRLAALSPIVTIGGSLVGALALLAGAIGSDALWDAVTIDELWQESHWGIDAEALATRAARRAEWDDAVRFLALLDA